MSPRTPTRAALARAGRVIKLAAVLSGTLYWAAASLAIWLVLFGLDNLLSLPAAIRFPLALAGGWYLLAGFVRHVARPLFRRVSVERTAVLLEQDQGVADNLLINACQLETQELATGERLFAEHALAQSSHALARIPVNSLWKRQVLARWSLVAAMLTMVWLLYGLAFPRYTVNALWRYVVPLGDVPPAGSVDLAMRPASDVTLDEGADLTVTADVQRDGKPDPAGVPPLIFWAEGLKAIAASRKAGESAQMLGNPLPGRYAYTFRSIRRSFSYRVLDDDTFSRAVKVTVQMKPKITAASFRVTPPSYTGLPAREGAGPPATLSGLPQSELETRIEFDQPLAAVTQRWGKTSFEFAHAGKVWTSHTLMTYAGPYTLEVRSTPKGHSSVVATGEVQLETDHAPEVAFAVENGNLLVAPGTEIPLTLRVTDDYGVSNIVVTCRAGDEAATGQGLRRIREWSYAGPPGNPGPVRENFTLAVSPAAFTPGETYLLEAEGWDYRPNTKPGRSKPVVLRVKALEDITLPRGDLLGEALEKLKRTLAAQKRANEATVNLRAHLDEAVAAGHIPMHRDRLVTEQTGTRSLARDACRAFLRFPSEGRQYSTRLAVLAEDEMGLALKQIAALKSGPSGELVDPLAKLAARQEYILSELMALLGRISNERAPTGKAVERRADKENALPPALRDAAAGTLSDDLGTFERAQKQILKHSRDLQDRQPEDLTKEQKEEILGALAREEAKWAKFLEEKLTDFSKLPQQDFSDAATARQLNEVIQDVDKAAESLYKQKLDMAVPLEQSGLEKAEALEHNLEKWLSSKPDNTKWSMEEPAAPADIPLAELPAELEDIVGELLDKEEEMQPDVEDVSSSWLDSMDKGAGWDASDGPISSMSAKGVTGNLLPNQMEIGGRSGEGRSGRSNGQMVQDTAEGKGGRQTPTRLSPSPFEPGQVKDSSTEDAGGATGGGKLSGFGESGLRGAAPPPPEKLARIAGRQARIRQEAEAMVLKLRRYKLPSGDVEASVTAMKAVETAASRQDGLRVRRSYSRAVDALAEARKSIRTEIGVHRENAVLPPAAAREIMMGLQEGTPEGYEELVADYFRRLAGEQR